MPWLRKFVADEGGDALIFVMGMMIVLLGFVGLATDAGMLAVRYRTAQNVVDSAALGAAQQISAGSDLSTASTIANEIAQNSGISTSNLTITYLDSTGHQTSDVGEVFYVRASIAETFQTLMLQVLGIKTDSVQANSTAGVAVTLPCVLCLIGYSNGVELDLTGNGNANVSNGGVIINSSGNNAATATGNGHLIAPTIGVVGGVSTSGNGYFQPYPTKVRPIPDPLAALPVPSFSGTNYGSVSGSKTLSPGIYNNITVGSNGTMNLQPGTYIITGSMSATGNGSFKGSGVTLYFTCGSINPQACSSTGQQGGSLSLTGNGSFQITAPTSGDYAGMVIFYDRNNTNTLRLTGNGSDQLTGSIYGKSATATLTGNGGIFQVNSLIVVDSAYLTGNGSIGIDYSKSLNYQRAGIPGITQ